jgi:hypothetical protein
MAQPQHQQFTRHTDAVGTQGAKASIETLQPNSNEDKMLPSEENRIAAAIATSKKQEQEAAYPGELEQPIASRIKHLQFKELLVILVQGVISKKITPDQARHYMHDWLKSLSDSAREDFIVNRNKADDTVNYFKGVVETLSQELPYLFTRM